VSRETYERNLEVLPRGPCPTPIPDLLNQSFDGSIIMDSDRVACSGRRGGRAGSFPANFPRQLSFASPPPSVVDPLEDMMYGSTEDNCPE